jgi:enoyl-CoA hydratase
MGYETLIVEIKDHVALIRLNRPEALNALNALLMSELAACLTDADNDSAVRCIVITGSDRAFAAGADIKEMATKTFVDAFSENFFARDAEVILRVRKPVIAAVAGYALGGGCELAMMCDFIICAENAKFGQPEVSLGIIAGMGGSQRLTRFVGKSKAMEMHLTGRLMDAAEAERAGLVSRVVALQSLLDEAMSAAAKIATQPMLAVTAAKEAINRSFETTLREGLNYERRLFHAMFATDDQKEGMAAFLEKRTPQFWNK